MSFLHSLPIWILALIIFFSRIIDVSLGTMRTITVVNGRIRISVILGFFEILIWVAAVSQVITRIQESPWLLFAYAGGFAMGNAVGILLERRIAIGNCIVRLISISRGKDIAERLRDLGQVLTTFEGAGRDGPHTMIYATCKRQDLKALVEKARQIDPQLFFTVERVAETSNFMPLPHATGWRAVFKKK